MVFLETDGKDNRNGRPRKISLHEKIPEVNGPRPRALLGLKGVLREFLLVRRSGEQTSSLFCQASQKDRLWASRRSRTSHSVLLN